MKVMYRLLALIMTVFMFASINTAFAVDDAYPSTYTYNYDYWSDIRESPDAYRVTDVIYGGDLGLDKAMRKPQSLFVRGDDLYVCDTGNNRILQITKTAEGYTLTRVIDQIKGTEVTGLNTPNDVFVDENDNIYIADTYNGRVVMVDKDLNFLKEFVKPNNAVFNIAQPALDTYTGAEAEDGTAVVVLPIGSYAVTEQTGTAAVEGFDLTVAGDNAAFDVREHKAAVIHMVNVYNVKDALQTDKIDAQKVDVAPKAYEELSEEELALVTAAEAETGAPHGVLRISASAIGADKPAGVSYNVAETKVNQPAIYFSDFRSGVLSVAVPAGNYTVNQDPATAKVPNFDTTIIGGEYNVWVRADMAVTADYINLYINDENPLDPAAYTAAASAYEELTEDEVLLIQDMEAKYAGTEYGIIRISASSVNAEIPSNTVFDQSLSFQPNKLVVDVSGRAFVLATNVNKGLIKFESDATFTGFIGANKVSYDFVEYVWKNYLSTAEQRAQQASFVPTEYRNIYIDPDSFIYATNISFSEYDLLWDVAQPIRRLNGIGNDILIKNDRYPPIGDLTWVEGSVTLGPSKLVDITVLDNDIYVAIDQTRGRIFGYDSQGVMLWAFGTTGSSHGTFNSAIAIEHMGNDLFVLDQNSGAVTVFTPTEYGNLIYDAVDSYLNGDYEGSANTWEEILKLNANYNLAFIGIGRALMRQENYEEAMDYFEMANDRENYGRAFRFWRAEWVEENIIWMVLVLAAVLVIPLVRRAIKKTRMEVEAYERNQVQK